jgi:hypothetical protein
MSAKFKPIVIKSRKTPVVDGLKGFPEAIQVEYPKAWVWLYIAHMAFLKLNCEKNSDFEKKYWRNGDFFARVNLVNQFQINPIKRIVSRLYFYAAIMTGFYVTGALQPPTEISEDSLVMVAKAYHGVPVAEVPEEYLKGRKY